jgi:two-component system, OmpR family, KDP operon response regulator KdpE
LPRVLIIDDDRALLNVCDVGLRAFGHEVWTAATGNEGLAEAAIRGPDVIVLDLGLPDLDGVEVCKRIRTWSEVPIVVLSADGSEDRKVGALHLDLVHYEATLDGRALDLTPKEFEFLAYLARNAGKVCTRRMILESVWGPQYGKEMHYLKVYAYRLRRKLHDEGGHFLQSDPSVGYRLIPPAETGTRG